MKETQEEIQKHLMENYSSIIGEDKEVFSGTYLPHVLAEFVHKDENTLQVSCHIGVELDKEEMIQEIKAKLESSLGQFDIGKWHYGGMGIAQRVAVNDMGQQFIQQPVHFVLTKTQSHESSDHQ